MNYDRQEYIGRESVGAVYTKPKHTKPYTKDERDFGMMFRLDVREKMIRWFKRGDHLKDTYSTDTEMYVPASETIALRIREDLADVLDDLCASILDQREWGYESDKHLYTLKTVENCNMRYTVEGSTPQHLILPTWRRISSR